MHMCTNDTCLTNYFVLNKYFSGYGNDQHSMMTGTQVFRVIGTQVPKKKFSTVTALNENDKI